MALGSAFEFAPHGMCWLWDWRLILLHSTSDLLTFAAYSTISLTALYAYRAGKLAGLYYAYPVLWRFGAAFVFFCGLSHLGNFLEVWYGGALYWLTGAIKVLMTAASLGFARLFWQRRMDVVAMGRALSRLMQLEKEGGGSANAGS